MHIWKGHQNDLCVLESGIIKKEMGKSTPAEKCDKINETNFIL